MLSPSSFTFSDEQHGTGGSVVNTVVQVLVEQQDGEVLDKLGLVEVMVQQDAGGAAAAGGGGGGGGCWSDKDSGFGAIARN
ncbi:hypothetical protein EC973_005807 [Apophysomyces ossiformis]|uniref:Uncharacterized protein n=1 Tax=Apophysomyces ossiformis TaxID=679940 RepID=A0A8H7ESN0_9FUNG|nr:hypothetical protein EC973_005807 [Apophysomyces ossiformis]